MTMNDGRLELQFENLGDKIGALAETTNSGFDEVRGDIKELQKAQTATDLNIAKILMNPAVRWGAGIVGGSGGLAGIAAVIHFFTNGGVPPGP